MSAQSNTIRLRTRDRLSHTQLKKNALIAKVNQPSPLIWCDATVTKRCTDNEVAIHRRLQHPNIIPVLEKKEGLPQLDLPIAWGSDLMSVLMQPHKFHFNAQAHACGIARQIAHALDHLHAQGVYHLDVKLDNIFLPRGKYDPNSSDVPQVWLGDFGLSCFGQARRGCAQYPVTSLGTRQNAPPEFFRTFVDTPISSRSYQSFDVWCFGILLFCMWTSEGFMAAEWMERWKGMSLSKIQSWVDHIIARKTCKDMPRGYKEAMVQCLRADWRERASMRDVKKLLVDSPFPPHLQQQFVTFPLQLQLKFLMNQLRSSASKPGGAETMDALWALEHLE